MKTKTLDLVVMALMVVLSFASLISKEFNVAGITVIIGVVWFFVSNRLNQIPLKESGLSIRTVGKHLSKPSIWFWILLPALCAFGFISVAKWIMPEMIDHVLARTGFLSWDNVLALIPQLAIAALGEEIAWRAFFFRQSKKYLPLIVAVLLNGFLFALGHYSAGSINVVLYDLASVMLDAVIFCIIMHKTDNAWISTIAHFLGNFASALFIFVLLV